jgi:hypothetical protein
LLLVNNSYVVVASRGSQPPAQGTGAGSCPRQDSGVFVFIGVKNRKKEKGETWKRQEERSTGWEKGINNCK